MQTTKNPQGHLSYKFVNDFDLTRQMQMFIAESRTRNESFNMRENFSGVTSKDKRLYSAFC